MSNSCLVADAEKCIGCRTCEIACVVEHSKIGMNTVDLPDQFTPRLHVIVGAKVTTAVVCRQCDNAPCANACPTEAIIWADNRIKVIQERCIGCKSCAIACPFGVMTVISGVDAAASHKSEAIKCDLCEGNENGPACIRVCPTNTLRVVDCSDLNKLITEKQKRTANKSSAE